MEMKEENEIPPVNWVSHLLISAIAVFIFTVIISIPLTVLPTYSDNDLSSTSLNGVSVGLGFLVAGLFAVCWSFINTLTVFYCLRQGYSTQRNAIQSAIVTFCVGLPIILLFGLNGGGSSLYFSGLMLGNTLMSIVLNRRYLGVQND